MEYKPKQFKDKYAKHHNYAENPNSYRDFDYGKVIDGKHKIKDNPKKRWTPEDQALEDILWASWNASSVSTRCPMESVKKTIVIASVLKGSIGEPKEREGLRY